MASNASLNFPQFFEGEDPRLQAHKLREFVSEVERLAAAVLPAAQDEAGGVALGDLSDVTIAAAANGDILVYNGGVWGNTKTVNGSLYFTATPRLQNGVYLQGENLATGTFYDLIGVNSSDVIEVGDPTRNVFYDATLHQFNGGDVAVRDGSALRLYDASNADQVNWTHNGTDLLQQAVGTRDFLIRDLTGGVAQESPGDGAYPYYRTVADASFASADGWVRIASNTGSNGRGGAKIWVSPIGGAGTPDPICITVYATWSSGAAPIKVEAGDANGSITLVRSGYDATNQKYIDIQVGNATATTYSILVEAFGLLGVAEAWKADPNTTAFTPTSSYQLDPRNRRIGVFESDGQELLSLTGGGTDKLFTSARALIGGETTFGIGGGAHLTVGNNSNAGYISATDGTRDALLGADAGGCLVGAFSNHDLYFRTNNTNRLRLEAAGGIFHVLTGTYLSVWDSSGVDYVRLRDDGTQSILETNNNPIYFNSGANIVGIIGGDNFRIHDATGSDYIQWVHDGTDLNVTGVNTTSFETVGLSFGLDYGIDGRYSDNGASVSYGATIWALDSSWRGAAAGTNSAPTSVYGIRWHRASHANADAKIGEGLYVYQAGTLYGGIGTAGAAAMVGGTLTQLGGGGSGPTIYAITVTNVGGATPAIAVSTSNVSGWSVSDGNQTGETVVTHNLALGTDYVVLLTADHGADPGADGQVAYVEDRGTNAFQIQMMDVTEAAEDGHTCHVILVNGAT